MIMSTTAIILIALAGSECITVGFLGRRIPDAACNDYLRGDRRLVLGPSSPTKTAACTRHRKIKSTATSATRKRSLHYALRVSTGADRFKVRAARPGPVMCAARVFSLSGLFLREARA